MNYKCIDPRRKEMDCPPECRSILKARYEEAVKVHRVTYDTYFKPYENVVKGLASAEVQRKIDLTWQLQERVWNNKEDAEEALKNASCERK